MLNRLALRLATVRALRGATMAGQNVLDSEHGAIDEIAEEHPKPVIVVYTDDASYAGGGRDLWSTQGDARADVGSQKLVIEMAMTQRMRVVDEDGDESESAIQPQTDASIEAALDLLERQVVAALMDVRPSAAWAECWREFAQSVGDRQSQRGVSMREGVRFAGRQLILGVRLSKDPVPGSPVGPLWQKFLTLAAADDALASLVPMLQSAIAGHGLPPWQVTRSALGLTLGEARALQITPPSAAEATSPAMSEAGSVDSVSVPPAFAPTFVE